MHTSFTDAEDKLLVQIAFQFEKEGLRVTWDYVARQMKTKRSARQLRLRLASLKRTYGKAISGFPPCFLRGMSSRRLLGAPPQPPPLVLQRPVRPACRPPATPSSAKGPYGDHHAPGDDISASATSGKEVPDSKEKEIQGRCDQGGGGCIVRSCGHPLVAIAKSASGTDFGSCGDNLDDVQAAEAVDIIFGSISAHDVRQPAGRTYDNAGEVVPSGVTLLLAAVGLLDEADVFLDVGAGVGNVLAQVELMTNVRACVGIELRRDLVSIGEHCMRLQHRKYPRLRKKMLSLLFHES
ncbi:hypothetical protein F443_21496 [Phytophthora nicotianae P1569]|uniref:DOT1 domain-containing protein n=1 Tax=Phytophthora nicotianae P1569 TaxID=1317065 RepID=V9DZ23_PHYNI|nr:hypothetical protein F443_21496 [Phytophthora nicotianae P1569]